MKGVNAARQKVRSSLAHPRESAERHQRLRRAGAVGTGFREEQAGEVRDLERLDLRPRHELSPNRQRLQARVQGTRERERL